MSRYMLLVVVTTCTLSLISAQECTEFSDSDHGIDTMANSIDVTCSRSGSNVTVTDATMIDDQCSVVCAEATQRLSPAASSNVWSCATESGPPVWVNFGVAPTMCIDACSVSDTYSPTCCAGLAPDTCAVEFGGCSADSECTGALLCGEAGESCTAEFETAAAANDTRCCVAPPPPAACSEESINGGTTYSATCCADRVMNAAGTCDEGFGGCEMDSECTGNLVCGDAGDSCSMAIETAAAANDTRCCVAPPPPPPACSEESILGDTPYSATCCEDLVMNGGSCDEGFGGCSDDSQCTGELVCGEARESCSAAFEGAAGADASTRCCEMPFEVACGATGEVAGETYFAANGRPAGCPQGGLPGVWSACTAECAQGLQTAIDALGGSDDACCNFRWYINEFAGANSDHGTYSDKAVMQLRDICDITIEGSCVAAANNGSVTGEDDSTTEGDSVTEGGSSTEDLDTAECFELARAFFNSSDDLVMGAETNPCPNDAPGVWDTCPAACATGIQVAVDELDCCLREYLNEFVSPGADSGSYADMAFDRVLTVCDLDLPASACFEPYADDGELDTEACFDLARDFFGSADDLIMGSDVDTNPCPAPAMFPGNWDECPAACADGIQAAVDELDCCLREYLNEFAGPGVDHGSYADMAFNNVMSICNLDLTNSSCFDEFTSTETLEDGAAQHATPLFLLLILGALALLCQ